MIIPFTLMRGHSRMLKMIWPMWVIVSTAIVLSIAITVVLHEMLTPKYNKLFTLLIFLSGAMMIRFLRVYLHIHMPLIPSNLIVDAIVFPLYTYIVFRFTCKDKSMKIILFTVLIFGIMLFSDIFSVLTYYLIFGEDILAFELTGSQSILTAFIPSFSIFLSLAVFLFWWKRYIGSIHSDIPNARSFLFILCGLLGSALFLSHHTFSFDEIHPIWGVSIMILIISYFAILQILFTNSKKKEAEDNLRELQHIRELEKVHYTAIEARRQELVKVRHDFSNQLATVYQLVAASEEEVAEKLLGELKQSIDSTIEYSFCQNAIVNAVLTEKQKDCDLEGIELEAKVAIGEEYNISPLHLCSIFTNLLDNAICACKPIAQDQRRIEIRTIVKGDYLHIKCVNPVTDNPIKGRSGKGYGKIILSDIANDYNGNFTAERIDNKYIAIISLLLSTMLT